MGAYDITYRTYSTAWMERYRRVCVTPCDTVIDVRRGYTFSLTSPLFPDPPDFDLSKRTGDVRITVAPGDAKLLEVGRWTTAVGALGSLFGTAALPSSFASDESPGFKAMTAGVLVGGAAMLAGGIVLIARYRTHLRFAPPAQAKAPPLWTGAF